MKANKKKIIIIVVIALILGAILYFILRKPKAPDASTATPGSTPVDSGVFPLKLGSKGSEVKALQSYLNNKYGASLVVDGSWGPATGAAVMQFLNRDNVSQAVYDKWNLS